MADDGDSKLTNLFARVARGKLDAFEQLFGEWAQPLRNYAFALTRRDDDADDAVAEAMLGLMKQGKRLRSVRKPKAYLFAAVRHAAWQNGRASKTSSASLDTTECDAPAAPGQDPAASLAVKDALMALPDEQREVVVLKVHGLLTFAEIAEVTNVSPNTAASRYRYAVEKLRLELGDMNDES